MFAALTSQAPGQIPFSAEAAVPTTQPSRVVEPLGKARQTWLADQRPSKRGELAATPIKRLRRPEPDHRVGRCCASSVAAGR